MNEVIERTETLLPEPAHALGALASPRLAAGSGGIRVYRTRDGGRNWTLVSETGPNGNRPGSLSYGCDKQIEFTSATVGWSRTAPECGQLFRY